MTDNQFFRNMDKPVLVFSALAETYFNMYGFGNWYGRRGGLAGEDVTGGMEFFGSGTLRVGVDSKFGLVGGDMNITLPTFITVEAKAVEKEGKTKELVAGVSEFKSRAVANVSSSIASLRANVSEDQASATETGGQTGEAIIGAATADKGAVDLKNPGAPVPSPPTGAALVAAAAGAQEAAEKSAKEAADKAFASAQKAAIKNSTEEAAGLASRAASDTAADAAKAADEAAAAATKAAEDAKAWKTLADKAAEEAATAGKNADEAAFAAYRAGEMVDYMDDYAEAATAASKAASDAAGAGADDAVDAGADAARNASNNAAGALDELDQAKAGLDEATSNLSKANGELDQAKAGVEEATSNLSKATEELDQARAGFDEATSNLSKATEELDNLKQARDGQLEQLDNLNKELDAAIANGDTAAREALTKQADELKIAINEASANINVKQIEVDGFADDLTLASNDVMFKQAEVDASTADLATAKSNVVAKQAEYDSAVEAAEAAQKNLDEALAAADAAANAQKLADDLFKQISENYEDLGDAWLSNALKIDDFGLDFKTLSELFTNPIFGRDDAIAEFVGYYKYDYGDGSWDGNNDVDSFSTTYTVGATNPNTGETAFAEQAPADQTQRRGPDVQPDGTTVLYWGFS